MKTRQSLIDALWSYQPLDAHEARMRDLIAAFVQAHEQCYQRSLLSGHLTGSAWVVDPLRRSTVLTHHAKLDKWLQAGGHADGDPDLLSVARRELLEETGLHGEVLLHGAIFDVDAHAIPARGDVPAHIHYDIRFAFEADPQAPLTVTSESHEVAWVPLDRVAGLNTDESVLRLVRKTPLRLPAVPS